MLVGSKDYIILANALEDRSVRVLSQEHNKVATILP